MTWRRYARRLFLGRAQDRLPRHIKIEMIEMLFNLRLPVALITTTVATFGWVMYRHTDSLTIAVTALVATGIGLLRMLQLEVYRRSRDKPLVFERWDMAFAFMSAVFAASLGTLSALAIIEPGGELQILGFALSLGYGVGLVSRSGFMAHLTRVAIGVMLVPTLSALVYATIAERGGADADILIALIVMFLLFMVGGFYTTRTMEASVVDTLISRDRYLDLARQDPLTGVANRLSLQQAYDAAVGQQLSIAVHCIDLDRFKPVNDRFGHAAGDALLKAVVLRLKSTLRDTDVLARTGGDEFVVLQFGVSDESSLSDLGDRLVQAVDQPFVIHSNRIRISASVGSAAAPAGATLDRATRIADIALYRAKALGRGTSVIADQPKAA